MTQRTFYKDRRVPDMAGRIEPYDGGIDFFGRWLLEPPTWRDRWRRLLNDIDRDERSTDPTDVGVVAGAGVEPA